MKITIPASGFLIILTAVFFISCHPTPSQNQDVGQNSEAIRSLLMTQEKAWNEGKIDLFMEGYQKDDSLSFITASGPIYGWENVRKMYHKSFPNLEKMGHLSFKIIRINPISDKVYQVLGRWQLDRNSDSKAGYFSLLLKQIDLQWKIVMDHTFSDPKKSGQE